MSNVYAAPTANLSNDDGVPDTRFFAINGRIGRVRWIGYVVGMWLLTTFASGALLFLVTQGDKDRMEALGFIHSIVALAGAAVVSRRRLQDLGLGVVFLGLAIIPFINLYFFFIMIFKRGDEGGNEYGPEPAPNDRAAYLLAWLLPALMVVGIVAAMVFP